MKKLVVPTGNPANGGASVAVCSKRPRTTAAWPFVDFLLPADDQKRRSVAP